MVFLSNERRTIIRSHKGFYIQWLSDLTVLSHTSSRYHIHVFKTPSKLTFSIVFQVYRGKYYFPSFGLNIYCGYALDPHHLNRLNEAVRTSTVTPSSFLSKHKETIIRFFHPKLSFAVYCIGM